MKLNFLFNRRQIFTGSLGDSCSHLGALPEPISAWCLCTQFFPWFRLAFPHTRAAGGAQWSVRLRCSQWYLVKKHRCSESRLSCWELTARLSTVTALPYQPPSPLASVPLDFAHLQPYAPSTPGKFLWFQSCDACELRGQAWIQLSEGGSSFPCVLNKVRNSLVNDSFTRVINGRGRFLQETKGTAVSYSHQVSLTSICSIALASFSAEWRWLWACLISYWT